MADAANVRLVRCPKCENLLSELPDFSIYKCGGCGAVLRGKNNGNLEDGLLEVSDDVKGSGHSEEGNIIKVPKVDVESADATESGGVERNHNEGMAFLGSSLSETERRNMLTDSDKIKRVKEMMRRIRDFDDEYQLYTHDLDSNRHRGNNCDLNEKRPEYSNFCSENVKEIRPPRDSLRSRPVGDQWGMKSNARCVPAQARSDDFLYREEGQSSYGMNPNHEQGERIRYPGHALDEFARIENLENGRAELLRKLDELKYQITWSCDVADKPKERICTDPRMLSPSLPDPYGRHHTTCVQEGLTSSQGIHKQLPLAPDGAPQYISHPAGFFPCTDKYSSRLPDSHPQRGYPDEFLCYPDATKPEMIRRHPHQCQYQFREQPYHEYFPGYYGDVNNALFQLQRHENFFHQPACSCVHCCQNWRMPQKVDPAGLLNRRSQTEPSNPNYHECVNPILHQPQGNASGGSNLYPMRSRQSLTLHPNVLDSGRPRKFVAAHKRGQVTHPIAGGAPFITCSNCFELLRLSRKHISLSENQYKMKCGACDSIILFELGDRGFVTSVSAQVDKVSAEIDEGSNGPNLNAGLNNYGGSQHNFAAMERNSNSGGSQKQLDPLSSTSSVYDDMDSPENILSRKHGSPSAELPLTEVKPFQEPDLSPEECLDHSPENNELSHSDKGGKIKKPEKERASFDITSSQENSVGDTAVATEISLNELSNSNVFQDSVKTNKGDCSKINKRGESFFAAFIKKGFGDFSKSNPGAEVDGSQVFVNGHFIPDRAVKKAERLAGPIQPGKYWYDKQAGFWGVMGHPCLGIIMPNIEEFSYPMPANCAAGDTGVFVNGRELNRRDLDLLAKRGLPITKNRSYLIQITGEVVDEQTGNELDCLGKLAPTVQRAQHGFGMKIPRFIAQSKS